MIDLSEWKYYYNLEGDTQVRANLVYTPLVSPDKTTFCMDFNRDTNYHIYSEENQLWTDNMLTDRFERELKYHSLMSKVMPTLRIKDVDYDNRRIFLEWFGDDFYMQSLNRGGFDNVLSNWQEQWIDRIQTMKNNNIVKISLHPNSWVAHNDVLYPLNWFFCIDKTEPPTTIRHYLCQISSNRQEKLAGLDLDKLLTPVEMQYIAFNSFKSNYPESLIDRILTEY